MLTVNAKRLWLAHPQGPRPTLLESRAPEAHPVPIYLRNKTLPADFCHTPLEPLVHLEILALDHSESRLETYSNAFGDADANDRN
jgi:hypothetical protein